MAGQELETRQGGGGGKRLKQAAAGSGKKRASFVASGVAYGYKAPVSMLLLPFLAQAYQREGFKFLHVVRDGRDIAFSGNQSPVGKFYRDSYADGAKKYDRWNSMPEVSCCL